MYEKVMDREKHAIACCPKCNSKEAEMIELIMKCKNCGWSYDPDERAFMKSRSQTKGIKSDGRRLRRGRPIGDKHDGTLMKEIIEYYLNNNDTMKEIAEKFKVSYSTVSKTIADFMEGKEGKA